MMRAKEELCSAACNLSWSTLLRFCQLILGKAVASYENPLWSSLSQAI